MAETIIIEIPEEIKSTFFFSGLNEFKLDESDLSSMSLKKPFIYEVAYYSSVDALKPWEENKDAIKALLERWKDHKESLEENFKNRDREAALIPMKYGIALFIQFIHWANESPVRLQPTINFDVLKIKPVNVQERFDFITSRPNLYHSYMQLNELMVELEKQFVKSLALKKIGK